MSTPQTFSIWGADARSANACVPGTRQPTFADGSVDRTSPVLIEVFTATSTYEAFRHYDDVRRRHERDAANA